MTVNPWSPKEVADAHGYFHNLNEISPHHDVFASFISGQDNARIIDIGCGNGRVLNNLDKYSSYLGIDTCKDLINSTTEYFKNEKNVSFLTLDIEKDFWPETMNAYNIIYLDSTFEMMNDPLLLLQKIIKKFDTIFFNRLQLFDLGETSCSKGTYKWGGMREECPRWKLSKKFLNNFAESNGGNFKIVSSESHVDGVCTCAILYER